MHLFGSSLQKCLYAIHKDIITIWNIRDLDEVRRGMYFKRVLTP